MAFLYPQPAVEFQCLVHFCSNYNTSPCASIQKFGSSNDTDNSFQEPYICRSFLLVACSLLPATAQGGTFYVSSIPFSLFECCRNCAPHAVSLWQLKLSCFAWVYLSQGEASLCHRQRDPCHVSWGSADAWNHNCLQRATADLQASSAEGVRRVRCDRLPWEGMVSLSVLVFSASEYAGKIHQERLRWAPSRPIPRDQRNACNTTNLGCTGGHE